MFKDGKLFGKLNIIDLLVIIIAVVVVVMVGLKMSGRGGSLSDSSTGSDIIYTVKVKGVDADAARSIQNFVTQAQAQGKPGDQLMASGALLNGYVTQVVSQESQASLRLRAGENSVVYAEQQDNMDLTFTVVAHVSNPIETKVGSQEVRVGKPHIVKTTHFELYEGIITGCEWKAVSGS